MTCRFSGSVLITCAVALGSLSPQVRAQEPPAHLIYPVKTDLQRELASAQANLLAFLDTTNVLKDNRIALDANKTADPRLSMLRRFAKAMDVPLAELLDEGKKGKSK